jgi:hypothetical protein
VYLFSANQHLCKARPFTHYLGGDGDGDSGMHGNGNGNERHLETI